MCARDRCVAACQGVQLALAMRSVCKALCANSYLSHEMYAVNLIGGVAKFILPSLPTRHEVRLANLLNLSI